MTPMSHKTVSLTVRPIQIKQGIEILAKTSIQYVVGHQAQGRILVFLDVITQP